MIVKSEYTADFETTGIKNYEQDGEVRVWLWSLVSIYDNEECYYGTTIETFIDKLISLKVTKVWFHNLRFDGYFLLYGLENNGYKFNIDYTIAIDNMGNWFEIRIIFNDLVCKVWDSLKKFPNQSVQSISKLYGIEGKKEYPDFNKYIPIIYLPTNKEIEYCIQDSKIMAYALQQEYKKGHDKITLSTDAFTEVKQLIGGKFWRNNFPLLSLDDDTWLRDAYGGGWVYVNPKYENKEVYNVNVYDINSMYPDKMKNFPLPYGYPNYNQNPDKDDLYVVRFKAIFQIKKGYLPTIHNHSSLIGVSKYYYYSDEPIQLTMTNIDYELFKEHYKFSIVEEEPFYRCFKSKVGLLAPYIDKYMKEKADATIENDLAKRLLAKLYLNSPYGKTGMRPNRISRQPYFDEDGIIKFKPVTTESESVYVPYAIFVCSWARNQIIRMAQDNIDKFVYADTDSLHLVDGGTIDNKEVHKTQLGKWKYEGNFDIAKYIRPKTYIHADNNYNVQEIKCAGMPDNIKMKLSYNDFLVGKEFEGKLIQKHVKGGCLLCPTTYRIKP